MDIKICCAQGSGLWLRLKNPMRGPPTRALFGENVCERKELGPVGGGLRPARPP